jgi:hypothetical protein
LLSLLVLLLSGCSSSIDREEMRRTLKSQAQETARAMVEDDHPRMVDFTHPKVVELSGGREKMVQMLEAISRDMKGRWPSRVAVVEDPTGMTEAGGDWYGIVPFTLQMTGKEMRGSLSSALIGVSSDGGRHWKFVDAGGKDLRQVKQLLPNFPEGLRLPVQRPPVYEKVK